MTIEFNEELKTGIYEIDKQHKELFKHVNELYMACLNGTGKQEVERIMEYLEEYVSLHFMTEESYMEKHSYPAYNKHKAAHNIFKSSFKDIKNSYLNEGPTANLVVKLNKNLINWLISHLGDADKKLAGYLMNKI